MLRSHAHAHAVHMQYICIYVPSEAAKNPIEAPLFGSRRGETPNKTSPALQLVAAPNSGPDTLANVALWKRYERGGTASHALCSSGSRSASGFGTSPISARDRLQHELWRLPCLRIEPWVQRQQRLPHQPRCACAGILQRHRRRFGRSDQRLHEQRRLRIPLRRRFYVPRVRDQDPFGRHGAALRALARRR